MRAQLAALSIDYQHAVVNAGLPMGSPVFQIGTVNRMRGGPGSDGFVLMTQ